MLPLESSPTVPSFIDVETYNAYDVFPELLSETCPEPSSVIDELPIVVAEVNLVT